jgi:hypothetical protein
VRDTYLNEDTNRIVYHRRTTYDLKVVPYNLAMIMDWESHINVEYSGSAYAALLYMYKYCYKGPAKSERIELLIDQEQDSLDEQKLFIYGRTMSSMSVVWTLCGYQDYPAYEPAVCSFKVRSKEQLKHFYDMGQVTDLNIYYHRPLPLLASLKFADFMKKYKNSQELPKYYQNRPNKEGVGYHKLYIQLKNKSPIRYIYKPVRGVEGIIRIEMLFPSSGDIYYLRLILINRDLLNYYDAHTYQPLRGGGLPIFFRITSKQHLPMGMSKMQWMYWVLMMNYAQWPLQKNVEDTLWY